MYVCVLTKSGLTLRDPVDCSPPGSSVHGISQARIPELVTLHLTVPALSCGMWDLGSLTRAPCTGVQSVSHWTAREVPSADTLIPDFRPPKGKE